MRGRNPGPDGEYQDWEFPDPDEVEELSNLPEPEGPPTIAGFPVSFLLKVIAFFIIAGLVGSLVLPVLQPLGGARPPESPVIDINQDIADYHGWLTDSVSRALDDSRNTAEAQFLGVQFGESGHDPIIGIQADGYDPVSAFPSAILHNPSIEVLKRVFADDRAETGNTGLAVERARRVFSATGAAGDHTQGARRIASTGRICAPPICPA